MGILERAGSTLFIGLALVIGLAGCGGPSASPEPSEPADLAIIRSWIAAMNEQDYATAKSLMADEVDTPGGRYAGDQIDAQLRTHCHRASIESFEAVGSAVIVDLRLVGREGGNCPAPADPIATFVFEVEDGLLVKVP